MPGPQFRNPSVLAPMRHEDANFDVSRRSVRLGARVGGTDHGFGKGFDQYGRMVPETTVNGSANTVGDILGPGLWPANTRSIPSWVTCAPAKVTTVGPPVKVTPVWKSDYSTDARFSDLTVTLPPAATAPSLGDTGVVIFGTNETNQENLFLPTKGTSGGGGAFSGVGQWYGDGSDGAVTLSAPTLTAGGPWYDGTTTGFIGGAGFINEWDYCVGPFGHYGSTPISVGGGGNAFYYYDLDGSDAAGTGVYNSSATPPAPYPHTGVFPRNIFFNTMPNGTFIHFLARDLMATSINGDQHNWLCPIGYIVYCQGSFNGYCSTDGDMGLLTQIFYGNPNGNFATATLSSAFAPTLPGCVGGNAVQSFGGPIDEGVAGNLVGANTGKKSGNGGDGGGSTGTPGVQGGLAGRPYPGGHPVHALPGAATFVDDPAETYQGVTWNGGSSGGNGGTDNTGEGSHGDPVGVQGGIGGRGGAPMLVRAFDVSGLTVLCRGGTGQDGYINFIGGFILFFGATVLPETTQAAGGGGGGNAGYASIITESPPGFIEPNSSSTNGLGGLGYSTGTGANNGADGGSPGFISMIKPV